MTWTKLNFGKHKGRTLPEVMFRDPDWFYWAYDEGAFAKRGLGTEADRIHARASLILPRANAQTHKEDPESELEVEYYVHRPTGRFGKFSVVPRSRPIHQGSSPAFRGRHIDFRVPREMADYDKLGSFLFISLLKHHVFGDASYRMTRKRAEAFFDDDSNFDLVREAA